MELAPGQWERVWTGLRRRDVLGRIGVALLAAIAMGLIVRAWDPPFAYRTGYTPDRDIMARVEFSLVDEFATETARSDAQKQVRRVYSRDNTRLAQLLASLRVTLVELTASKTVSEVDPGTWQEFQLPAEKAETDEPPTTEEQDRRFQEFVATFTPQENLDRFETAMTAAFDPFRNRGILGQLPVELERGNREEILVYPIDEVESLPSPVRISDVLVGDGTAIHDSLRDQFESADVADRLFAWLWPRLRELSTLEFDEVATRRDQEQAAGVVEDVLITYGPDQPDRPLAKAGQPLTPEKIEHLRLEYDASLAARPIGQRLIRATAMVLMIFVMFILCGAFMRYRQLGPLASWSRLSVVLTMAVITVALARWASADAWRAEIIPLLIFCMTMVIVYRQELALLLSGVLALVLVMAIGHGLHEFLLLLGVSVAAGTNSGRIRSRSKLIYVGLFAGAVAIMLDVGMSLIDNQPLGWTLMTNAARNGLWALAAGFLMTGLLPFIEQIFGVLTDLSLLELGDVAHPLLQELVRRAPSTYNHSVTVGSIAEAAADSIGARGLLVRVGAYFHDIGKMLKPGYYIENVGSGDNAHEDLVPAMSTLVIIAHIKDGSDLAKQHHLPQPIIDLIKQHHGTTLVEFFYDRANRQQQADPNGGGVDESTYRYPGPKPQTKEAAVLMLADAVESASRTLVDPTPARIESLVRGLAERRLHGGQFDESGLTLRELRTIEKSMAKSLTSIYHGRIKYPDQVTA
ncbi:MAG: HDIG domain-containing metalloprotein [Thermoguttaceae bacterium]